LNAPGNNAGMAPFVECSARHRCGVCDGPDWCTYTTDGRVRQCMRVLTAEGARRKTGADGQEFALYFTGSGPAPTGYPTKPAAACASVEERHAFYTALLAALPLWPEHRDALCNRGLSDDAIDAAGYRSLPSATRERAVALKAAREALGGGELPRDLPGIHLGKIVAAAGLLIPVRDAGERIVALKVRTGRADAKYVWFAGRPEDNGASAGAPAHVPLGAASTLAALAAGQPRAVRVTEGPLKADVATALSGVPTIGIPSASAVRCIAPALRALGVSVVRLAWDADARKRPADVRRVNHVAGGLEMAAHLLASELPEVAIELETWATDEEHQPKGVDDTLAAGAELTVHTGAEMWRELVAILREAGRDPRAETLVKAGMEDDAQPAAPVDSPATAVAVQPGDDWRSQLLPTASGAARKCLTNAMVILRSAPEWKGRLAWDEMSLTAALDGEPLDDMHVTGIRTAVERAWGFDPGSGDGWSAILAIAHERPFHPVRDWLDSLRGQWDGVKRLHRVASEVLGAHDALSGVMIKKTLIAAVERVRRPGCKVETCTVLVGPQGWMKSTFWRVLAGPQGQWFTDTHIDISNKDAFLQIGDAWIIELGEVEKVTSRRGADEIKPFLSSVEDRYVPKYERAVKRRKRGCIFVGSTNEGQFLEDPTGSRRYWCITLGHAVKIELLRARAIQLWAEAVAICDACTLEDPGRGAALWCLTPEEEGVRVETATAYEVEDTWSGMIVRWAREQTRADHTMEEVLHGAIGLRKEDQSDRVTKRVSKLLRALKCYSDKQRIWRAGVQSAHPVRHWVFPEEVTGIVAGDDASGSDFDAGPQWEGSHAGVA
jgi:predicted P-loop ATPase